MAKRKMTNKLIFIDDIKEKIKPIKGSSTDYISENGNIYKEYKKNWFYPKKSKILQGYVYCGITFDNRKNNKSCRVHRLVAEAFIPKEKGKEIVGHKDNNKSNNTVSNLYWTTIQENTQKAFDDGLAKNKKGYEDNQSKPVIVYDINFKEIARYGSIRECSRITGAKVGTIFNQCNNETTKTRTGYYYRYQK